MASLQIQECQYLLLPFFFNTKKRGTSASQTARKHLVQGSSRTATYTRRSCYRRNHCGTVCSRRCRWRTIQMLWLLMMMWVTTCPFRSLIDSRRAGMWREVGHVMLRGVRGILAARWGIRWTRLGRDRWIYGKVRVRLDGVNSIAARLAMRQERQ